VNHPKILALMRSRIDLLQQGLPAFQKIRRFTLLSRDFCGDEITPTMKLRRKVIRERFHQILEGMYQPQGHGIHDSGFCVVSESPVAENEPRTDSRS
jgi:long-chain acyl-CoA synthetase